MKKPWAIYLLAGFYALILVLIALMFFHVRSDLHGHRYWFSPWAGLGSFKEKIILFFIAILPFFAMIGLWQGKKWGRNLSLALCIYPITATGLHFLQIFAILEPEKFTGFDLFVKIIYVLVFLILIIVFCLALHPEVGRYCHIYSKDN